MSHHRVHRRPPSSPLPLRYSIAVAVLLARTTIRPIHGQRRGQAESTIIWWCGATIEDASTSCLQSCPLGYGCPDGTYCFSGITSCDDAVAATTTTTTATTNAYVVDDDDDDASGPPTITSTGTAAVEETFLAMRTAIDERLFLYETPLMDWVPSSVYRFDGFFDGMRIMHSEGVAGNTLYMGGECHHCHMYGLINVAAFLAQAMKETIRYDACDENSWDRVGDLMMYPLSNACGQLGQSYQDYHCDEDERHMECAVDADMTITAVTNARWWGAPGPLKCGPRSLYPQTGYWDYNHVCDDVWADPPKTCDEYDGQLGGGANNDVPYPNGAGRTDVEGCCWWGRGVIQTSGICNFGKLNYFLGKRAADDGRESRYPDIDFCEDPEVICSSQEHSELKWIAGFFYWINAVQSYDEGGWNYIDELRGYVDGGMLGDEFINAVSGIVNRGCHNPPCGTGDLDGGPERADNFHRIIDEMKFAFVDIVPESTATTAQDDGLNILSETPEPTPTTPSPLPPETALPFPNTDTSEPTPSPLPVETSLDWPTPSQLITDVSGTPGPTPPPLFVETSSEWPAYLPSTIGVFETPGPTPPPLHAETSSEPPASSLPFPNTETSEPTPSPLPAETSLNWPTSLPLTTDVSETPGPTPPPLPAETSPERPASPSLTTDLPYLLIAESVPSSSPQVVAGTSENQAQAEFSPSAEEISGPAEARYVCGDGMDGDESNTTADVTFDYDLYNDIEISVGEALRDVKESMLSDITGRMGCNPVLVTERRLIAGFEHIIGLTSNVQDILDPNASGCIVHVESDERAICTPVSGGFTISAKPGTSASLLEQSLMSLKTIVREGMDSGLYVSEKTHKAIYIGDRESNSFARASAPPDNAQGHVTKASNKNLIGAVVGLSLACLLLICLLCLHVKRARRDRRTDRYGRDEEVAFGKFNRNVSRTRRTSGWSSMAPEIDDYLAGPQRRPHTPPQSRNLSGEETYRDGSGAGFYRTRRTSQMGYPMHWPEKATSTGRQNEGSPFRMGEEAVSQVSLEEGSDSSDSGDPSALTGDTSECHRVNDTEEKIPFRDGGVCDNTLNNDERKSYVERTPTEFNESIDTPRSNPLYAREERQKRLEHARARAAQRKSLGL